VSVRRDDTAATERRVDILKFDPLPVCNSSDTSAVVSAKICKT